MVGRRTRARRRQAWVAGGVGSFVLAAVIAGGAVLPSLYSVGITRDVSSGSVGPSAGGEPVIRLVSYKGVQPDGYRLGKIPDGFTVETSDKAALILAPTGLAVSPAADGMADFRGKIVISQSSLFAYKVDKREVTINGMPAVIALTSGAEPATMVQFAADGHTVQIQIWNTINLTDEQIIDFAESIAVTGNPVTLRGSRIFGYPGSAGGRLSGHTRVGDARRGNRDVSVLRHGMERATSVTTVELRN